MERRDIDWSNLGFAYQPTNFSYVCDWEDGAWGEGRLTSEHTITISECAGILHYCQEVFEGLKAYTTQDGRIVCFRPDLNAQRMADSAQRLVMPEFPQDRFIEAVREVVAANADWVPPFGSGASLYVRPFMFATGNVLGVAPASAYQFRILVTPVGPYFRGGAKPIRLRISDTDRAAPKGTGNIKAGLNYAMSLQAGTRAHELGFAENLYLDSQTRTYIEETGGANVLLVDRAGHLVVPQSSTDSILPSITRRSLVQVARDLGMEVEERPVTWQEALDGAFVECGLCGTAAVISPVGEVHDGERVVSFEQGHDEPGPVMTRLRETLTAIQAGQFDDTHGWVVEVMAADGIRAS